MKGVTCIFVWIFLSKFLPFGICKTDHTDKTFEFIILHNNDMHARFEKQTGYGGFGRTSKLLKDFRRQADNHEIPPVIYLNAGDTFTGTIWFSIYRRQIATEFVNALNPTVMSLGNHEFDDGVRNMTLFTAGVKSPIVCANCDFSRQPKAGTFVRPYVIKTINGRKVGIIGYITKETISHANTENVGFQDEVTTIRKYAEQLTKKGINIIIAVGHSGFEVDINICEQVEQVDIVVGGHTNTFLWHGDPQTVPSKERPEGHYPFLVQKKGHSKTVCPVVQAYAYTKYLGHLHVQFDKEGHLLQSDSNDSYVIYINDTFEEDPAILELLEKYRPKVDEMERRIIGNAAVDLSYKDCRLGECNIANMILDAFIDYKASNYNISKGGWTDTPIAIINGGAIRSEIPKGNITMSRLFTTMPFFQKLVSFTIKGETIKKTLETGVKMEVVKLAGEFIQVSGIHYMIDRSRKPLNRIITVRVRCGNCKIPKYDPLDLEKKYRVVTILFLANGGNGHLALQEREDTTIESVYDTEVVQRYLQFMPFIRAEVEERIYYTKPSLQSRSLVPRSHTTRHIPRHYTVLHILLFCNYFLNLCYKI